MIKAASFYLSDNIKEGLEILMNLSLKGKGEFSYYGVDFSIWEPFENTSVNNLLSYIEDLAEEFKSVYEQGKNDAKILLENE